MLLRFFFVRAYFLRDLRFVAQLEKSGDQERSAQEDRAAESPTADPQPRSRCFEKRALALAEHEIGDAFDLEQLALAPQRFARALQSIPFFGGAMNALARRALLRIRGEPVLQRGPAVNESFVRELVDDAFFRVA